MSDVVLIAVIGFLQAVTVAIIGILSARDNRRRKKQLDDAEVRAALRAEESRLNMKLLSASLGLSVETARAIQRSEMKTNGEMKAALEKAEDMKTEYYGFINSVAARHITA